MKRFVPSSKIRIESPLWIDQEQRNAVEVAIAARGARGYDMHIGHVAVDDKTLGAAEAEAVAGALRLELDGLRPVLRGFIDRKRTKQRALRDLR
jgi:hypothetical protein